MARVLDFSEDINLVKTNYDLVAVYVPFQNKILINFLENNLAILLMK